jgi:NADH-quinone oxidoreductase subunit N
MSGSFLASGPEIEVVMPFVWPALAALLILLFGKDGRRAVDPTAFTIAALGLGLGLVQFAWCWQTGPVHAAYAEALRVDRFTVFAASLVYVSAFLALVIGAEAMRDGDRGRREFPVAVLFGALGLGLAVASRDLLLTLLGFEIAGLSALAQLQVRHRRSEAGVKLIFGQGLAFGLGAFGLALIMRATGTTSVSALGASAAPITLALGLGTFATGLAMRIGLAPFHLIANDLAEEGSAAVGTFATTAWPLAGLAALARLGLELGPDSELGAGLRDVLWWLALLTMTVGNLAALGQQSLRRILASAAVARAGWMLLALVAGLEAAAGGEETALPGMAALLIAGAALVIGQGGAFALLARLEGPGRRMRLEDLCGLGRREPATAVALSVFAAVLAGIPGTIGFLGRFAVVSAALGAAIRTGDEAFTILAILGIVNGLVGLAAYLRIPIRIFLDGDRPETATPRRRDPSVTWTVVLVGLTFSALWLGFGPELAGFGVDSALALAQDAATHMR